MWVIFLLAALSVAICMLLIIYLGNKVYLKIEKDNKKYKKENEK